jgi:hemoglobin-like flavoprotein
MASYYPHKQTTLIAILCIIAVGGVFIYAKSDQPTDKTALGPTPTSSIDVTSSKKTDDTLASTTDWKLSFLEKPASSIRNTAPSASLEDLTLTDQFGRDFFARYIQLKQSNLIENQPFVTDTLNQSIYNAARAAEQPKVFTAADISIIAEATATNIKVYGNTLGSTFSTYGVDADPAIIANDAFEKGDMNLLKQIDPIVSSYETITTQLKNTPVPQPLAPYHVDLLNAVSSMAKISRDIRGVEHDPMQTMVSVSAYTAVQNNLLTSLKSIKSYFALTGITFAPTEPGSLFSQLQ